MDRSQNQSKSPSIRGLIRQGLAVQITLSLLILAAVLVAFAFRLQLVNDQERGTRAIGELRSATVALLSTVESIDKYSRLAKSDQLAQYNASVTELRRRLTPLIRKTQPYSKSIAHKAVWVEPELMAEIEYRAKSAEGKVRHPVFKGLREDF